MTTIVLFALIIGCTVMWTRVEDLRRRVLILEYGHPVFDERSLADAISSPTPPPIVDRTLAPAAPRPDDIVPDEPEPDLAIASALDPVMTDAPVVARGFGFEDIFGRRLPIWAGGVTLAVAGFLIVKYSIDAGLLSPAIRVVCGLLFGGGLIAGAESALRGEAKVRDVRVRQSLSGAGIATLYASVLVAANLYHLVEPLTAFGGMAAITALAGMLAIRFGAPSALLGLVGGLAAPALVGSGTPDIPLLSVYLALAVGGLCALSRSQRWMWLGTGALVGGFGWGLMLIAGSALDTTASLSVGGYVMLLAIGLPLMLAGDYRGRIVQIAGVLIGCAQMAALVAIGGFEPLHWALFGLISVAIVWLSRREAALADLAAIGLATELLLIAAWHDPTPVMLAIILAATIVIYGGASLWRLWRTDGRIGDAGQIAALSVAIVVLPLIHVHGIADDKVMTGLCLLGTGISGGAAAMGWRHVARRSDVRFPLLVVTAAALAVLAGYFALPIWAFSAWAAIVAGDLLLLSGYAYDRRIEASGCVFGLATIAMVFMSGVFDGDLARAVGIGRNLDLQSTIAWGVPALVAIQFAIRSRIARNAPIAQGLAVALGYIAAAQLVPTVALPLVPIAVLVGFLARPLRAPLTALAVASAIALGWAALPFLTWALAAVRALFGQPMFMGALPTLPAVGLRIAVPGLIALLVVRRIALPRVVRDGGSAVAALLGLVAAHILFKHLFAIDSWLAFAAYGMAERTLWETMLFGAAMVAWYLANRWLAIGLALASLAHFAWFTLLLHDPLWREQAVGGWPVLNLLLPAYGTALAILWAVGRTALALPVGVDRSRDFGQMALILLFVASTLRQLAHGSLFVFGDVTPGEDIARSIVAVAVAIGFLWWGITRRARDWRIASLVLMLGAVVKVFVFDASGLDGLMRIGSFAALGFSLIGIGWIYSRYLPEAAPLTPVS